MKFKRDRYFKVRGGKAKLLEIICTNCQAVVFDYQKDGIGGLHRCYANRILAPAELVTKFVSDKPPEKISCANCSAVIAHAHKHTDGRLAYNLVLGTYRKVSKSDS